MCSIGWLVSTKPKSFTIAGTYCAKDKSFGDLQKIIRGAVAEFKVIAKAAKDE
jgi:hypothetical protein